ncbi:HTH_Tnp_Tc3_2 domain-containing protein [Trichonephila clavipes]|nr:HTH_Tnp_Tc3_2 domain-containing protein [Trichonephila clavipes]
MQPTGIRYRRTGSAPNELVSVAIGYMTRGHLLFASLDTFEQLKKCITAGFELITSNSQFERGRFIGLKEGGWANRRIIRRMGRSNVAIRRCWKEWVDNGRFQHHDGSGRPMATEDQKDRLIADSAVIALDSSLSTIRCTIPHHDHSQMVDSAKLRSF